MRLGPSSNPMRARSNGKKNFFAMRLIVTLLEPRYQGPEVREVMAGLSFVVLPSLARLDEARMVCARQRPKLLLRHLFDGRQPRSRKGTRILTCGGRRLLKAG